MVEVNWTISALEDVNNIAEYIAKDSAIYASLTVESFFDTIEILIANPNAGKTVQEINNPTIRELIDGSYRIIYKVINDRQIDIITVHHASRLISNNKTLKPFKNK